MNPEMVADYTPRSVRSAKPRPLKMAGPSARQPLRRRARDWNGHVGRVSHEKHGPGVHRRPRVPPSILLTGMIVNKDGQRFVAEDSYRSRTSGFVWISRTAACLIISEAHMERPEMPLIKFIDGWETMEEMGCGTWYSGGEPDPILDR